MGNTPLEMSYAETYLEIQKGERLFPMYIIYWPDIDEFDWVTFQGLKSCRMNGALIIDRFDTRNTDGLHDFETGELMSPDEFIFTYDINEPDLRDSISAAIQNDQLYERW